MRKVRKHQEEERRKNIGNYEQEQKIKEFYWQQIKN